MLGWLASAAGAAVVFMLVGFLIPIFIDPGDDRVRAGAPQRPAGGGLRRRRRGSRSATSEPPHPARHSRGSPRAAQPHRRASTARTLRPRRARGQARRRSAWFGRRGRVLACQRHRLHSWDVRRRGRRPRSGSAARPPARSSTSRRERILRPVTALRPRSGAEQRGMVAPGVRGRLIGAWALGTGVPLLGVVMVGVAVVASRSPTSTSSTWPRPCCSSASWPWVPGMLATLFAAKAIADPVTSVRAGLERIERGDLDARVPSTTAARWACCRPASTRWPTACASASGSATCSAARWARTWRAPRWPRAPRLGGEEREIGALFVDVVGSTSMAHGHAADRGRAAAQPLLPRGGRGGRGRGRAGEQVRGRRRAVRVRRAGTARRPGRRRAARRTGSSPGACARDMPEIDFGIGVSAGHRRGRQRGRRAPLRVHGDRRPGERGGAPVRAGQARGPSAVLASEAALARADDVETAGWTVGDSEVLRGRNVATGVAHPVG